MVGEVVLLRKVRQFIQVQGCPKLRQRPDEGLHPRAVPKRESLIQSNQRFLLLWIFFGLSRTMHEILALKESKMTTAYPTKSLFTPKSPMQMEIIPERIMFSGVTVGAAKAQSTKIFQWGTQQVGDCSLEF